MFRLTCALPRRRLTVQPLHSPSYQRLISILAASRATLSIHQNPLLQLDNWVLRPPPLDHHLLFLTTTTSTISHERPPRPPMSSPSSSPKHQPVCMLPVHEFEAATPSSAPNRIQPRSISKARSIRVKLSLRRSPVGLVSTRTTISVRETQC
jgi:hypothetical protein